MLCASTRKGKISHTAKRSVGVKPEGRVPTWMVVGVKPINATRMVKSVLSETLRAHNNPQNPTTKDVGG